MTARERVLVFRYGQLGDTVVALPAFWAIRRHYADAHITLLTSTHKDQHFVSALSVLPADGLFDDYLIYQTTENGIRMREAVKLFAQVWAGCYRTLVYLPPVRPSPLAALRDLAFFRAARVRKIVGQQGRRSISRGPMNLPLAPVAHETDYLLSRLAKSGIPVPGPGLAVNELALRRDERQAAEKWLGDRLGAFEDTLLVGFGPGSKAPSKIWPAERYEQLGRVMIERANITPIVFGGPEDAGIGRSLVRAWGRGLVAAGEHSVRVSAALLAHCAVYVGNDSGAMHLAAAERVPCVAVFSAQDWPGRWYPYGAAHRVLREQVPCEGCRLHECDRGLPCLLRISVERVATHCLELIAARPGKTLKR
jgi:heptosyltransferase-3